MASILRDLIVRFFGSEDVEMQFITPPSPMAPAPRAEAQTAIEPADAPGIPVEVAARRGAQPLVLRSAPQAE